MITTSLKVGDTLRIGDELRSPHNLYFAGVEPDGDLTSNRRGGGWAASVLPDLLLDDGEHSTTAVMQGDGNLVLWWGGAVVGATHTDGHPGAHAQLEDDGRFRVLSAEGVELFSSPADPNAPPVPPEPPGAGESGFLTTSGIELLDDMGRPHCLRGYTTHTLLNIVAEDEGRAGAVLDEGIGYGANLFVVIGCHLSQWKKDHGFYYDPRNPNHSRWLGRLFDLAADRHARVLYRSLADADDLSKAEQLAIWKRDCAVMQDRWNVVGSPMNEDLANHVIDPGLFPRHDVGRVLLSRGSRGEDTPPYGSMDGQAGYWDVAEYEPTRRTVPKSLSDSGAGTLELVAGYPGAQGRVGPVTVPLWISEPAFFHDTPTDQWGDRRWCDPKLALALGLNIAANYSMGAFGASDGLICRPLGPVAAECARQFYRGMKAAFQR